MSKNFNLTSLLSDKSKEGKKTKQSNCPRTGFIVQNIYIGDLVPDPNNFYTVDDVAELKDSILMFGLQQNLAVRENLDGTFTVISGHRRLKALNELVEEGYEQFEEVPCKIETPLDKVREELKLILANATTRVLSDYEKTHQAARIKELLTMLKNSGSKLPGRMREIVADTLNVSPTQVARMEAIENNLTPEFKEEFKQDKVNITVAYELSGLPKEKQEEAYEQYKDKGTLKINDVKVLKTENKDKSLKRQQENKEKSSGVIEYQYGNISVTPYEKQKPKTLKIYVSSPYCGLDDNYLKACGYCKQVVEQGHIPFASHVMLHGIIEEPEGREKGITAGIEMVKICDELWVFGDEITEDMNRVIEEAKRLCKKVDYYMEEVS